jgi:molybdopterin converting factor small subunit
MNLYVKLFGPQAQMTGKSALSVHLDGESPTVADLLRALAEAEPELARSLPKSRLAVNFEFADSSQCLHPGDELALIGMISGG